MDTNTKDILETVNFIKDYIVDNMATKEDIARLDKKIDAVDIKVDGILEELKDIKNRLKELERLVENHAGYGKEIDHALERIARIEKHLGIAQR